MRERKRAQCEESAAEQYVAGAGNYMCYVTQKASKRQLEKLTSLRLLVQTECDAEGEDPTTVSVSPRSSPPGLSWPWTLLEGVKEEQEPAPTAKALKKTKRRTSNPYLSEPQPEAEAQAASVAAKTDELEIVFGSVNRGSFSPEFQTICNQFLARKKVTSLQELHLPSNLQYMRELLPGEPAASSTTAQGFKRQHWSENTSRRLEGTSCSFWLKLMEIEAPDLFQKACAVVPDVAWLEPESPGNFFDGFPAEQHEIAKKLFCFSHHPENLRAMDFNPLQHNVVVDGHELQVRVIRSIL